MTPFQSYILKRLLFTVITVFIVVFTVFTISRSAGDPVTAYVGQDTPPEIIEVIREKYHLNDPIPVQFIYWLNGILHGEWGRAQSRGREPIVELIPRYLPITLELNLYVLVLSLPLGYWLGTKAATNKDTWIDHFSRLLAIIGQCVPEFFVGLLILMFLYPQGLIVINPQFTFQRITGMPTIDALLNGDLNGLVLAFKYLIGPLLTSFISSLSMHTRLLRSSILEELSKDYILTGRSKGLSKNYIEKRYARRNALIPFITVVGFWMGHLIAGGAIIEVVFNRYGLGMVLAEAAKATDHNALQAYVLIYAIILVVSNTIVDVIYGYLDPRIKTR